jgi:hypothetical protein
MSSSGQMLVIEIHSKALMTLYTGVYFYLFSSNGITDYQGLADSGDSLNFGLL